MLLMFDADSGRDGAERRQDETYRYQSPKTLRKI